MAAVWPWFWFWFWSWSWFWFLFLLAEPPSGGCHSYQTESLFLSFPELAALEADSRQDPDPDREAREDRDLEVRCHEDSMEVVLRAATFDSGLLEEPQRLRLGPVPAPPCTARSSGPGQLSIRAPLRQCGGTAMVSDSAALYSNLLLYVPPASPAGSWAAAIPVQCVYTRRLMVSSRRMKPAWNPLLSHQPSFSAQRSLGNAKFSR